MTQAIPYGKEIAADTLLMRRFGVETLPSHETRYVHLAHLIVPDAGRIERSARRLMKSIQQVGILQAPTVMLCTGVDIHDPDATFEVIAGRRRVVAARLAGLEVVKCEVYETSTPQLASLITLIENEQRSSAWIKEVEALRKLIDEEVGMTIDDLASLGFDRASLSERLKVAYLPGPLVVQVLAGGITRETARRLIRLTRTQQEQIAQLAERGEEITVSTVKQALRAQIDAGFAPLQGQLAQTWSLTQPPPFVATPADTGLVSLENGTDMIPPNAAPSTPGSALATLITDLRRFERSNDYRSAPQAVRSLTTTLLQQVQVYLRTTQSPHE